VIEGLLKHFSANFILKEVLLEYSACLDQVSFRRWGFWNLYSTTRRRFFCSLQLCSCPHNSHVIGRSRSSNQDYKFILLLGRNLNLFDTLFNTL